MKKVFANSALALGMVATLVACGDGGGSGGGLLQGCRPVGGGGTQISSTTSAACTGCGISDGPRAIDGDGSSYATLNMPANSGGTVTLRATAQSGILFASGSLAGFTHSFGYGTSTGLSIGLTTYAGGTLQEQFSFNNSPVGSSDHSPNQPGRVSYTTSRQYDALEVSFTRVGGSGVVAARLHEFCSN